MITSLTLGLRPSNKGITRMCALPWVSPQVIPHILVMPLTLGLTKAEQRHNQNVGTIVGLTSCSTFILVMPLTSNLAIALKQGHN